MVKFSLYLNRRVFVMRLASFGQLGLISDPHIKFPKNPEPVLPRKSKLHYSKVQWDVLRHTHVTNTSLSEYK